MARTKYITVTEEGPTKLADVRGRILLPGPGFTRMSVVAEAEERKIFDSKNGKYVRTGALRDSLTSTAASGAIRRVLPTAFEFGTSVWYARFQGTRGPGKHKRPSAILKPRQVEAAIAARGLLDYVLHGDKL